MCIFGDKVKTTEGAPAIAPFQDQDTALLKPTELRGEDDQVGIEYGSSKKQGSTASSNRTGTDALKIPLNESTTQSETGGMNV